MTIKLTDTCTGDAFEYQSAFEMYEELRNAASDEDLSKLWELCHKVQMNVEHLLCYRKLNDFAGTMNFRVTVAR